MQNIPLPNQIKVAPKPTPEPGEPGASSTSGSPKPVRQLRPHLTSRLGDQHSEAFAKMAEAAKQSSKAMRDLDKAKANHPAGKAAQAEPVRNKRRTGRRAQRP